MVDVLPNVVGRSRKTESTRIPEYELYRDSDNDICVNVSTVIKPGASAHIGLTVPLSFFDRLRIMFGCNPVVDVMLLGPGVRSTHDSTQGAVIVSLGGLW